MGVTEAVDNGAIVRRFRAKIQKRGVNPFVDVPGEVSRAFARYGRGGRVRVEGRVEDAPLHATLVPVSGGGHRLYVNGGMRAAAGVTVGDTVSFALRPVRPEVVHPPADLRDALRRAPDARAAFGALSPSYRRELLRYVDDARTPEGRRGRIRTLIEDVRAGGSKGRGDDRGSDSGRRGAGDRLRARPLWKCPRCGNAFVNRNQWHSCGRHSLERLFTGSPPEVRALFERFRSMVEACGPVALVPYRDRVGFMVRVRFAGAVPRSGWLDVGFWLPRRVDSPRFRRVETIHPQAHVHTIRVFAPQQLDAELAGWIREAYAVGCQEHLRGASG